MSKTIATTILALIISVSWAQEIENITLMNNTPLGSIGNDIWGYVDSAGTEYAIAGTRANTQIYSLADPYNPELIYTVPGERSSIWRDYKTFGNYIYGVADQGEEGVTIIDMTHAPDSISYTRWTDTVSISGTEQAINTCHNIYMDDRGRAYLAGCNVGNGGVLIYDVTASPLNPELLGIEDFTYAHDVINHGDTMYASEIYEGNLAAYDISDIANIKLISRIQTSSTFTHNAWPSDDGKYIFTTDETGNGNLDSYDISDPSQMKRLDTYRPKANGGIIPHNAHYIDGFLVTSWYSEGIVVVDGSHPSNLVKVAQYDTSPQDGQGCWGAYPYLPSGIILATDMENGLFILQPNYQKAGYLEGVVRDIDNGNAVNGAQVQISAGKLDANDNSNANGNYSIGIPHTGIAEVIVSHPDYIMDTLIVELLQGEVVAQDFLLKSQKMYTINGKVTDTDGTPISQARVVINSPTGDKAMLTNGNGEYSLSSIGGDISINVAAWGYKQVSISSELIEDKLFDTMLEDGYEDDFFAEMGWKVTGTASAGIWTRAIPRETRLGESISNPGMDVATDIGEKCYVTGNNNSSLGVDDVDNGPTSITSPPMDISGYDRARIDFYAWFFNGGGSGTPNDSMTIEIVDGENLIYALSIKESASEWKPYSIIVNDLTDAKQIQLKVTVSDEGNGHIVEGGFDAFSVSEAGGTTSTVDLAEQPNTILLFPNPTSEYFQIKAAEDMEIVRVDVYNMLGQHLITTNDKIIKTGHLPTGSYHVVVTDSNQKKRSAHLQVQR